jgi:hypothetical protein
MALWKNSGHGQAFEAVEKGTIAAKLISRKLWPYSNESTCINDSKLDEGEVQHAYLAERRH